MNTDTAVRDARQAVERAAWSCGGFLCTAPIVDLAATVLMLWGTEERQPGQAGDLGLAYRCLETLSPLWRTGAPLTTDDARALLDLLGDEFVAQGVPVDLDAERGLLLIPTGSRHPADRGLPQLAVTVIPRDRDGGWALTLPQRGAPMVRLAAPCDRGGAAAVARLVIHITTGQRDSPFV